MITPFPLVIDLLELVILMNQIDSNLFEVGYVVDEIFDVASSFLPLERKIKLPTL